MSKNIDFERIKNADVKSKDTVNGFIRDFQMKYLSTNLVNIPELINYLCLAYYYIIKFKWDIGKFDGIHLDCDTITKRQNAYGSFTAFLDYVINNGKHHWCFKINKCLTNSWSISIGIWNIIDNKDEYGEPLLMDKPYDTDFTYANKGAIINKIIYF